MTIRTFIAVDIGALDELVSFEDALVRLGAELKLVEPENIHITLKFLGETDEDLVDDLMRIITESSADIKPFKLELIGAGAFPNLNYLKVLWVGMKNYDSLEILAKNLDTKLTQLGFKTEKRGFKPHVTLARVKSRKKKNAIKDLLIKNKNRIFAELEVNNIRLKKSVLDSRGPTYYTLGEVSLE